ncbi:M15 family metallopeptidase [Myceligenerans crystallogenes]|uniref:D-alanyl-D-alanine carboxypeptidase-like core domain-containing protein n=1 Tax=Myceligenerans crystallogenes TaxID=316335 RepID=A0ABN2N851_9MICO
MNQSEIWPPVTGSDQQSRIDPFAGLGPASARRERRRRRAARRGQMVAVVVTGSVALVAGGSYALFQSGGSGDDGAPAGVAAPALSPSPAGPGTPLRQAADPLRKPPEKAPADDEPTVPAEDEAATAGAAGAEAQATAGSDAAAASSDTSPAAEPDTSGEQDTPEPTADEPAIGTCPHPDQVWTPENGHLSAGKLAALPFAPGHAVRADVVDGLVALNAAYRAAFGVNLTINSSYRSYEDQAALYDPSSPTAAPPGCSNHGTGLAVDIGGGVEAFGSAQYDWLTAHAEGHGWVHPPFAEPGGRNPEPWHWQSTLAPNSY